jgi:hypothetical protein
MGYGTHCPLFVKTAGEFALSKGAAEGKYLIIGPREPGKYSLSRGRERVEVRVERDEMTAC